MDANHPIGGGSVGYAKRLIPWIGWEPGGNRGSGLERRGFAWEVTV